MAIRSITFNNTEAASLVLTPSGGPIPDGDIVVLVVHTDELTDNPVWPAGFTQVAAPITTSSHLLLAMATKVASGEGASYTVSNNFGLRGAVIALSGRDTTPVVHRFSTAVNNTQVANPWNLVSGAYGSVTDEECDIIFFGGSEPQFQAAYDYTAPSGFTEAGTMGSNGSHAVVAYKEAATAGEDGTDTASCSAPGSSVARTAVWSVAFAAAGEAGGSAEDPFDGSGTLSSNWTQQTAVSITRSGGVAVNNGAAEASAYWNARSFTNDQRAICTRPVVSQYAGPMVRASGVTGARNHYRAQTNGTLELVLTKVVAGTETVMQFTGEIPIPQGARIEIEAEGGLVRAYVDGVQRGTDQSDASLTTGAPGMWFTATSGDTIDDWVGYDFLDGPQRQTWYPTDAAAVGSNHGDLATSAPSTATTTTGWTVGTTAVDNYARMGYAVERTAATFSSTAQPSGAPDNTLGDCFRTPDARTGNYDAGLWTFSFPVRASTLAAGQDGRVRVRMWRSANADGSSATEITSGAVELSNVTDIATGADSTSTGTVALGEVTLNDEYLFIQVAWRVTGVASGLDAIPTYVGAGTYTFNAAAISVPWAGGHQSGDLGILMVASANQTIATPSGWTPGPNSPQFMGTANAAGGIRLAVFYRFATSSAEADASVGDSGNHNIGQILVFRGVDQTTPFNTSTGTTASTNTSITLPGVTTTINNCLILHCVGTDVDANDLDNFTGYTNSNLSDLAELVDRSVNTQLGGGLIAAAGGLATAGATGDTIATSDSGVNTNRAFITLAIAPVAADVSGADVLLRVGTGTNIVTPAYQDSVAATATVAGVSAASAVGQVSVTTGGAVGATVVVVGVSAAATVGIPTVSGAATRVAVGLTTTTALGTVVIRAAATYVVVGVSAAATVGTPTVRVSVTSTVAIPVLVSAITAPTITGTARAPPSGLSVATNLPTVIVNAAASTAVTGVTASSAVGTVTVTGTAHPTITGVSVSTTIGSPTTSGTANCAPTGQSTTATTGTVTVLAGASSQITGVVVDSEVGTPNISGDTNNFVSGVGVAAIVGEVAISTVTPTDVVVSGVSVTTATGTVAPSGTAVASPSGVSAATGVDDATPNANSNPSVGGVSCGSAVGSTTISGGASVPVEGIAVSAQVGEVTPSGNSLVSVTGVSVATAVADNVEVTNATPADVIVSGLSVVTHVGAVDIRHGTTVTVESASAITAIGNVTPSGTSNNSILGVVADIIVEPSSVIADSNSSSNGIGLSTAIGNTTIRAAAVVPNDGVSVSTHVDEITVSASARVAAAGVSTSTNVGAALPVVGTYTEITVVGQTLTTAIGSVSVTVAASIPVDGLVLSSIVEDVPVVGDAVHVPPPRPAPDIGYFPIPNRGQPSGGGGAFASAAFSRALDRKSKKDELEETLEDESEDLIVEVPEPEPTYYAETKGGRVRLLVTKIRLVEGEAVKPRLVLREVRTR